MRQIDKVGERLPLQRTWTWRQKKFDPHELWPPCASRKIETNVNWPNLLCFESRLCGRGGLCHPCDLTPSYTPFVFPQNASDQDSTLTAFPVCLRYTARHGKRNSAASTLMTSLSWCSLNPNKLDIWPQRPRHCAAAIAMHFAMGGGGTSLGVAHFMRGGWLWSLLGWWPVGGVASMEGRGIESKGLVKPELRSAPILLCAFFKGREGEKEKITSDKTTRNPWLLGPGSVFLNCRVMRTVEETVSSAAETEVCIGAELDVSIAPPYGASFQIAPEMGMRLRCKGLFPPTKRLRIRMDLLFFSHGDYQRLVRLLQSRKGRKLPRVKTACPLSGLLIMLVLGRHFI